MPNPRPRPVGPAAYANDSLDRIRRGGDAARAVDGEGAGSGGCSVQVGNAPDPVAVPVERDGDDGANDRIDSGRSHCLPWMRGAGAAQHGATGLAVLEVRDSMPVGVTAVMSVTRRLAMTLPDEPS